MARVALFVLFSIACSPDVEPLRGTVDVSILYATTRGRTGDPSAERFYGGGRGGPEVGRAHVRVPHDPRMGDRELGEPARVATLASIEPLAQISSDAPAALVFVPGFDVSFEGGARRAAQLGYDLEFEGQVVLFSWASLGGYGGDEVEVLRSAPQLRDLIERLHEQVGTVHVVAHGMGVRAIATALNSLELDHSAVHIGELALVAPDVDLREFIDRIAPAIGGRVERLTVYVSSGERALAHDYDGSLLGDTDNGVPLGDQFETVDASAVDTSLLGHAYWGDRRSVVTDLRGLLSDRDRDALMEQHIGRATYYVIEAPPEVPFHAPGCSVSGPLGGR